ncbi:MAG TPA: twin-arginine translocase subunit TatC [Chloroflexia bacterium]|nr:twin-arginine translocase subunit TatC [Chloroflexia bacterium]
MSNSHLMSTLSSIRQRLPFGKRNGRPPRTSRRRPDGSLDVEMPLMDHLREFRDRLIKSALTVLIFTSLSFVFVDREIEVLLGMTGGRNLIAITVTENFVAYVKVALMTGIGLSMPVLVYQLFQFLAPGLTRNEKRWILISLPGVMAFFVMGVVFCYFLVLPSALEFLLNFGSPQIEIQPTISEYLGFVTNFMLALGLAFETPLIIFILSKLGVATPKRLKRFRRWAYVLAFVAAAIITPTPDPVNQTYVAVPIILLYELGILFAWLGRPRTKKAA